MPFSDSLKPVIQLNPRPVSSFAASPHPRPTPNKKHLGRIGASWLVIWNMNFIFHKGESFPLTNIFQDGENHQPDQYGGFLSHVGNPKWMVYNVYNGSPTLKYGLFTA